MTGTGAAAGSITLNMVRVDWPEEFQCPCCQAWIALDDDYERARCECGAVMLHPVMSYVSPAPAEAARDGGREEG